MDAPMPEQKKSILSMDDANIRIDLWKEPSDFAIQKVNEILSSTLSVGDAIFWRILMEFKVENGRPTQD